MITYNKFIILANSDVTDLGAIHLSSKIQCQSLTLSKNQSLIGWFDLIIKELMVLSDKWMTVLMLK